jgi:hypothetical protein
MHIVLCYTHTEWIKTDGHDIADLLLKVALSTITRKQFVAGFLHLYAFAFYSICSIIYMFLIFKNQMTKKII